MNASSVANLQYKTCFDLQKVGGYMFFIFFASTFFNSISIWIFYKAKLYTPINLFFITLIILNLVASYIEGPVIIYFAYYCEYNFMQDDLNIFRLKFCFI
jgi:hypothetical protein